MRVLASPGLTAGRGLKQAGRRSDRESARASPGLTAGRGLKHLLFVLPHRSGGLSVVLDAKTDAGSYLVAGVRNGRIRTITPLDDTDGGRLASWIQRSLVPGSKMYARNKETIVKTMVSTSAPDRADSVEASPRSGVHFITRDALVKRHGENFYQGARGAFNPEKLVIAFLNGSDPSTPLHEGAHFFLDTDIYLASKLEAEASAFGYDTLKPGERQILNDVSALFRDYGVNGDIKEQLRQWHTMDFEEQRAHFTGRDVPGRNASPGLTAGRGLKRHTGRRTQASRRRIARPHGRARIETPSMLRT